MLDTFRQLTQESDFLLFSYPEAARFSIKDEEQFITQYLRQPQHLLLLAEVDGEVIGNIAINQGRFEKQAHMGELGIAILRKYWNMGIGRRLMTAGIRWATEHPELEMIWFTVFANNEKAIQLYRNFGFLEYGRLPQGARSSDGGYYDLLTMAKRIKNL